MEKCYLCDEPVDKEKGIIFWKDEETGELHICHADCEVAHKWIK